MLECYLASAVLIRLSVNAFSQLTILISATVRQLKPVNQVSVYNQTETELSFC